MKMFHLQLFVVSEESTKDCYCSLNLYLISHLIFILRYQILIIRGTFLDSVCLSAVSLITLSSVKVTSAAQGDENLSKSFNEIARTCREMHIFCLYSYVIFLSSLSLGDICPPKPKKEY